MNNDVKNSEGETVGFRCHICDQVKTKMWGTVCNECARKNERETVEWQKGYDFAKKEEKTKIDWRTNEQDEAVKNLFRDYLRNIIRDEIWRYHDLGINFLKQHNLEASSQLVTEINELCLKSHNEVLEMIIKKYL